MRNPTAQAIVDASKIIDDVNRDLGGISFVSQLSAADCYNLYMRAMQAAQLLEQACKLKLAEEGAEAARTRRAVIAGRLVSIRTDAS